MKTLTKSILSLLIFTFFASFAYGDGNPAQTPSLGNHCDKGRVPDKDFTCEQSDVDNGNYGCSSVGEVIKGADVD